MTGPSAGAYTGFSELVVPRPLAGIGQYLVSLVNLFEFLFGVGALVAVGVEFHGLLAKSPADILFANSPAHAENVVIIPVSHLRTPLCSALQADFDTKTVPSHYRAGIVAAQGRVRPDLLLIQSLDVGISRPVYQDNWSNRLVLRTLRT